MPVATSWRTGPLRQSPVRGFRSGGRGFTLVEVMVVIALIAIATAVAVPDLSTWFVNARTRDAAGLFQENLQWGRAYALKSDQQLDMNVTALGAAGCTWSFTLAPAGGSVVGAPLMTTLTYKKRFGGISCSAGVGATFPLVLMPDGTVMAPPPNGGAPVITNGYLAFATVSDTAKFATWLVKYYGAGELRSCIMAPLGAQQTAVCANQ
ncbi:MAG: pilus assembly FimT family protein [Acidiferrobacter sp.]